MTEIEVFVIVDGDGNVVANADLDEASTLANDNDLGPVRRVLKLCIKMPTPEPLEVAVELPGEDADATVTVK